MKQYLDLLQNILDNGVEKQSGRANMPNTIGISHASIRMEMGEGFPLLTTKKMYLKGIIHELLWFLRGETNIKYLVDNNVNIWNGDAYRWYCKWWDEHGSMLHKDSSSRDFSKAETIEIFIERIKTYPKEDITFSHWNKFTNSVTTYTLGDLGKVYGHQWRNQNGVDQVRDVIEGLRDNPYSRYHIIDGWNKADFKDMALPPCHLLYQFIVRPLSGDERFDIFNKRNNLIGEQTDLNPNVTEENKHKIMDRRDIPRFYLDLNMYQRSCDTFLGVPFNIASMSLLLHIFAKTSNMIPGIATWIGGDTHLYVDHIPMVKEQLSREPYPLPQLMIIKELNNLEDILALTVDDIALGVYYSHDTIKAELFTGLKK